MKQAIFFYLLHYLLFHNNDNKRVCGFIMKNSSPRWNMKKQQQSRSVLFATSKSKEEEKAIRGRKNPALWRLLHDDTSVQKKQPIVLKQRPQVMAPVGGWSQLVAAVSNGADCVYVGCSTFSARARADNFDPTTELPKVVQYCHSTGNTKVYVALNTLAFPHELTEIVTLLQQIVAAKVDAIIVQDLGVAQLIQHLYSTHYLDSHYKKLPHIHASTQQSITNAGGVFFAKDVSHANRVVLGRELSVAEIENVSTHVGHSANVELETFVHGALCVSYSGQCFSSEAWGGRSANRGQCAQACRLPYTLVVNGQPTTGDTTYALSPQDLCGLDHVRDLILAGVSCLKIEGRLKDASYVAATTRAYRQKVTEEWNALYPNLQESYSPPKANVQITKAELKQMFARGQDEEHDGLSAGFFNGSTHQTLVRGNSPRHRGVHVGKIITPPHKSKRRGIFIQLSSSQNDKLKLGDGIVVDRGIPHEYELGGKIYHIQEISSTEVFVQFGKQTNSQWNNYEQQFSGVELAPMNTNVWKTSDVTVEKKISQLVNLLPITDNDDIDLPMGTIQRIQIQGNVDEALQFELEVLDNDKKTWIGKGMSSETLQLAEKSSLSPSSILKSIGKFGTTPWTYNDSEDVVDMSLLDTNAWCPISQIKHVRRQAIQDIQTQYQQQQQKEKEEENETTAFVDPITFVSNLLQKKQINKNSIKEEENKTNKNGMKISVLLRYYEQVDALCDFLELQNDNENDTWNRVDEIMIDFLEVDGMRNAVNRIRQLSSSRDIEVIVASPRIIKPGEEGIWRTLLSLKSDGLLVRSAGLLHQFHQVLGGTGTKVNLSEDEQVEIPKLMGDFSLNVANALTAYEYIHSSNLSRITASYDLNANSITQLATSMINTDASLLEVVAHCHIPIFHTEHCVFARFLSKGNSYLDCGHVCTRNTLHLQDNMEDHRNQHHLVLADMGCRNTIFSAEAQSGLHTLHEWHAAGIQRIRLEFTDESFDDIKLILNGYVNVLDKNQKPKDVWHEFNNQIRDSNGRLTGITLGSFQNTHQRKAGTTTQ